MHVYMVFSIQYEYGQTNFATKQLLQKQNQRLISEL
jgi:hypothetical protein